MTRLSFPCCGPSLGAIRAVRYPTCIPDDIVWNTRPKNSLYSWRSSKKSSLVLLALVSGIQTGTSSGECHGSRGNRQGVEPNGSEEMDDQIPKAPRRGSGSGDYTEETGGASERGNNDRDRGADRTKKLTPSGVPVFVYGPSTTRREVLDYVKQLAAFFKGKGFD